ncbi:MAG: DUF5678 domain-containing protein [Fibrobacteria bacterium]
MKTAQATMLDQEFKYFQENQVELVSKYNGKYLVIRDQNVVGAYDSRGEAYTAAVKQFPVGTFLIQHCLPGSESYTQTFHSRVQFH